MKKFRSKNSLEGINEETYNEQSVQEDMGGTNSRRQVVQNSRLASSSQIDGTDVRVDNPNNNSNLDISESALNSSRRRGEDPVSRQQREQMNEQIKQFQEKSFKEGNQAIERAQNLVKDIERQSKKRGIGESDDQRQQYYQQLIRTKREFEEEYQKKSKEFYMTEGMDMNKIQNFIIENFEMNLQQQRNILNFEIKKKEEQAELHYQENKKLFPQRLPQVANIRQHFFRQSQEIFRPLKQIEIKQIYQQIKDSQKTIDVQEYQEPRAADRLEEDYYKSYQEWSNTQPQIEDQRNRLKEIFAECFDLASSLNNQPESMEKPLIWHSLQFSEQQKEIVDKWMNKKNLIKNNKYGFLEEDEEDQAADDVLQKVEKYLDTELFISTYDKDDNVSDEEISKLQKGSDEPYNEQTIHFYDQAQESEQEHQ